MKRTENNLKEYPWQQEKGFNSKAELCPSLTYTPPKEYTWIMNILPADRVEAQGVPAVEKIDTSSSWIVYSVIFVFLLFTITMSLIYMYHWQKFNFNDPFIQKFSIFYFVGLCLLLIPLIFNLIF